MGFSPLDFFYDRPTTSLGDFISFISSYLAIAIALSISLFLTESNLLKRLLSNISKLFRKPSLTYKQRRDLLIRKKNSLTLAQVKKGIEISQYVKYIGSFLAILTASFAFKYSENEVYSKISGSVSVTSGMTALVSEVVKEKILEPQQKRLETLSLPTSNTFNSYTTAFASSSSGTLSSYRTAPTFSES